MVTIGIKVYYGEMGDKLVTELTKDTVSEFEALATTQIVGARSIPQLQAPPNAIDVTSLEDTEEQSEPGLISSSSLQIPFNYKTNVYQDENEEHSQDGSNFEQCLDISQDDKERIFKIVLPNGRYFLFLAKCRTVAGEMPQASALTFTVTLYKRSKVYTGMIPKSKDGDKPSVQTLDVGLVKAAPVTPVVKTSTEKADTEESDEEE